MLINRLKRNGDYTPHVSKTMIRDIKLTEWFTARHKKVINTLINWLIETKQETSIFHYNGKSHNILQLNQREITSLVLVKKNSEEEKHLLPYFKLEEDKRKASDILTILLNYCTGEAELGYLTGDEDKYVISSARKEILNNIKIEYEQSLKFIKKIRLINMIS